MSEITEKTEITLPFMSETEIARLSVSALSNRPNEHSGQYGRKGLTPEQVKEAFSALPVAIAARMNELLPLIRQKLQESDANITDICDIINEVIRGLDGKIGKLQRPSDLTNIAYVYGEDAEGNTVLLKGNYGSEAGTLVYRGKDGTFNVKTPTSFSHPVSKQYFDTKNKNSLYSEVTDMERRVQSLEHSANGNIYGTVTLRGSSSALQVDNACPYGILTRLGGNVAKITVGLPFDTQSAKAYGGNAITENISPNSVSMPRGEKYNIRIPCMITAPCTVTVYATEPGTAYLNKGGLMDAGKSQIGSQVLFRDGVAEIVYDSGTADAEYICITKTSQGTELTEPCYLNGIRIMISDPTKAECLYTVEEIEIPAEIRALDGYGEEGAYVDFTERKFYGADGVSIDVSAYLPEESDILSLLPSAIVSFSDGSGNAVAADYELSYKNKI